MSESKKRKVHSPEFKAKVGLEALRGLKTLNEIGQEYEVHPITVGQWKKDPLKCCAALKTWLGPVGQATDDQLRIMWNYLCSSGFRIGKIQHPCINQIRQSVRGEIIKRKIKFR